jgi:hypothetical protein
MVETLSTQPRGVGDGPGATPVTGVGEGSEPKLGVATASDPSGGGGSDQELGFTRTPSDSEGPVIASRPVGTQEFISEESPKSLRTGDEAVAREEHPAIISQTTSAQPDHAPRPSIVEKVETISTQPRGAGDGLGATPVPSVGEGSELELGFAVTAEQTRVSNGPGKGLGATSKQNVTVSEQSIAVSEQNVTVSEQNTRVSNGPGEGLGATSEQTAIPVGHIDRVSCVSCLAVCIKF